MIRAVALAYLLWLVPVAAQAGPRVVCVLDRPVIDTSQTDSATVYTDAAHNKPLTVQWSALAGSFAGPPPAPPKAPAKTGQYVTWRPGPASPGRYELSARVSTEAGKMIGTCSVSVLVVAKTVVPEPTPTPGWQPTPPSAPQNFSARGLGPTPSAPPAAAAVAPANSPSEAERGLLVHGKMENVHYGLYSYILLAARPSDGNKEKYNAVLNFYLSLEDIDLEQFIPPEQLNATYVPVMSFQQKPDLPWLIENYDYQRARDLLFKLQIHGGDGPYLISALRPLSAEGDLGPVLEQDLSTTPTAVVNDWMRAFRSETTQQRVWEQRSLGNFLLNMRTALEVMSEGLFEVTKVVEVINVTKTP